METESEDFEFPEERYTRGEKHVFAGGSTYCERAIKINWTSPEEERIFCVEPKKVPVGEPTDNENTELLREVMEKITKKNSLRKVRSTLKHVKQQLNQLVRRMRLLA